MAQALHVLVYGTLDAGVCDTYRFGMHRETLAARGIELRGMSRFELGVPMEEAGSLDAAFASDGAVLDRSEIDWADVIVFRRFYLTQWSCAECALVNPDKARLERHRAGTGHAIVEPDRLIRRLFGALEAYPELLRGRAMVYETDDDLLNTTSWNGVSQRVAPERQVVERMLRRADLVTVSTPVLAERHRRFNDAIRVVRNAVDPAWYAGPRSEPPPAGDPRILFYAKPNRMRDYNVCRPAVDRVVGRVPDARRVWLGALDSPAGGSPDPVIAAVDEVGPYVSGVAAFARSLADARPDIGLAPLVGDTYDQAKSELHWLEYTMAGAATVASGMAGGGPFDAIRDGVDGLVARDGGEWLAALTRLAESRTLREELAGRARERVLADYTVEARAGDWAAAYRWAAEHAGRSTGGRVHGLGALPTAVLEAEARASIVHRQRARDAADAAPATLAQIRGEREVCWPPLDAADPVVTVIVPVVDEPTALVLRAVGSVLSGSHDRLEIVVAMPAARADAFGSLAGLDARLRLLPVEPPDRPGAGGAATSREAWTGHLLDAAVRASSGAWVAPLSPEAVFDPGHVATLLAVATEHRLEFVYGQAGVTFGGGEPFLIGAWPPNPDGVLTIGSELFSRRLFEVARFDPEAWREAEAPGWRFWRSLATAGVRMASVETPVVWLNDAPVPPASAATAGPR
jgi:glycosyltransferase involved in cell wall biosynthesis